MVSVVDFLQGILRYSAPDRASHGWARMCMYQASDAMDSAGRLAGLIAAQLAVDGLSRKGIQKLLHSNEERLRTAEPPRLPGLSYRKEDLSRMPPWIYEQIQCSATVVSLGLNQVVDKSQGKSQKWFRHCLYQLSLIMDELGGLNQLIAAVHADIMDRDTLARYQHLFQQRPRSEMPNSEDKAYLAGLQGRAALQGRPTTDAEATWELIGRSHARTRKSRPGDSHESRVLQALAALDSTLRPLRWKISDGKVLDRTRNTAVAHLNAITAVEHYEEDFSPLHWLPPHERHLAEKVAVSVFRADTGSFSQSTDAKYAESRGDGR
ncbi:hypothetical protein ACIGT4_16060 [Streptomyces sioyaensis]|uniref:hypothetical protein n=1 Tax=Streptomyces sioyaensis TaxID=67364 RepID=UPI0037D0E5B1